ncbi:MAG: hypothetical protein JWP20_2216, partial [Roseomonas sp.]|nr:hypothetical protein [Roseomonas sp.]
WCGTGIRMDPVHGSPPSQDSARQALEPTPVVYEGQPHPIPTMSRDQTARAASAAFEAGQERL